MKLNTESLTLGQCLRLATFDRGLIGTEDYLGVAYFWSHEYRHLLRDASAFRRRLAHKRLLNAGLDPSGESTEHLRIIKDVVDTAPHRRAMARMYGVEKA